MVIEIKYEGYIQKESKLIKDLISLKRIKIPSSICYNKIQGLSNEVKLKLSELQPENVGQASRISGVTPAAVQVFRIWLQSAAC